jgi:hypothetical protein
MSSFLYIAYSTPATVDLVEPELHRFVVEHCAGSVLNNTLQQFRFNITREAQEVFVEPFLAGASFWALLGNDKKRPMLHAFLQAMFRWAASRGFASRVVVVGSRPRRTDEIASFDTLEQFIHTFLPREPTSS